MDLEVNDEQPKSGWPLQHLPWIAGLAWLVVVALKAMLVARGDIETAVALLTSSDALQIGFYVLVAAIPFAALSVLTYVNARALAAPKGRGRLWWAVASVGLLVIAA
jgi:hypothetical protein